jgi:monoamine oxidase
VLNETRFAFGRERRDPPVPAQDAPIVHLVHVGSPAVCEQAPQWRIGAVRHERRILHAVAERIETDFVVVGAGLAGLTAARHLVDAGREVVVLEARDRVGGRTLNHTFADGTVVELGGQWIGPTQRRMERLTRELGLETFPTYNTGEHLLQFGTASARYRGTIPPISPVVVADMAQAQTRFDRMARRVPLEAPWTAPNAETWDTQTFETWIRRNAFTPKARSLLRLYSAAVFAAEPGDFSLLHALFYTHSGGGVDMLAGTHGGAQQDRIVGGSQLVALKLAEQLGERVRLSTPVRRIEQRGDRVFVLGDAQLVAAERAIVAIPPTLAARIAYNPPMPGFRDQLLQHLPAGSVIKCNVVYDSPFWRDDGLTGQATRDHGPVKITFDNSPPSGSPGVMLAFLEGEAARKLGRASEAERRDAVVASLVDLFGPKARTPADYVELDWSAQEWTRGCYGAHFPTGVWTQYGRALREPVGRVHWAGAELGTVWSGYMDGAVQSGERAAAGVLEAAEPRAAVSGPGAGVTPGS